MITINTDTSFRNLKDAFDRLRPVIITTGSKHVITYKKQTFNVPITREQRIIKGNTR